MREPCGGGEALVAETFVASHGNFNLRVED
jgi:hypothetical protein